MIERGDIEPRELPESGAQVLGTGLQQTLVYTGRYADLELLMPEYGSTIFDSFPGLSVQQSTLTRTRGGLGKLVVQLGTTSAPPDVPDSTPLKVVIEVDYQQYEQPILLHPDLAVGGGAMREHLQAWIDNGKPLDYGYLSGGEPETLTEDEQAWADLILAGTDHYLVYAPVVIRRSIYRNRPAISAPGKIEAPPQPIVGFEFLKTADTRTQNTDHTWSRMEQWTGAYEWNRLLYKEAT